MLMQKLEKIKPFVRVNRMGEISELSDSVRLNRIALPMDF